MSDKPQGPEDPEPAIMMCFMCLGPAPGETLCPCQKSEQAHAEWVARHPEIIEARKAKPKQDTDR